MADRQDNAATTMNVFFTDLAAPFEDAEVKVRTESGREMSYITARTAMNRLDEVCGPGNWWDEFVPLEHSVICRLSVRLPDGTVVTKSDAGGMAGMKDPGDDEKSGFADAFKRAAVKFGVGRYLYRDGVPYFVRATMQQFDNPLLLPQPKGGGGYQSSSRPDFGPPPSRSNGSAPQGNGGGNGNGNYGDPTTGGALFAWAKKKTDAEPALDLVKRIDKWAQAKGFPYKWKEWTGEMVAEAYSLARKVVESGGESAPAQAPIQRNYDPNTSTEEDIPF